MLLIKEIAKQKDVRLCELADALNVTPDAISHWIAGRRKPCIETLCKIADVLKCTTDELLGRAV